MHPKEHLVESGFKLGMLLKVIESEFEADGEDGGPRCLRFHSSEAWCSQGNEESRDSQLGQWINPQSVTRRIAPEVDGRSTR